MENSSQNIRGHTDIFTVRRSGYFEKSSNRPVQNYSVCTGIAPRDDTTRPISHRAPAAAAAAVAFSESFLLSAAWRN